MGIEKPGVLCYNESLRWTLVSLQERKEFRFEMGKSFKGKSVAKESAEEWT